ncbi:MAG: DUF2845 domain-containing protein [Syntrophales bacterium]|nr:DUF2845 domain-containing protein [Syntrophales bacterium]
MNVRKIIICVVCGLIMCIDQPVLAFRCGSGLVNIGDSKSKVIIECGPPTYKEKVGVTDKTYYSGDPAKRHGKTRKSKTVEQWTYNCGESDFIYLLTFEGGKLVKEETVGRGKGKSQCLGRR